MFKQSITLTRPASLALQRSMSSQEQDVLFETVNNAGVITLNRPKALNSLNRSMVTKLLTKLPEWENQKSLVIIKGAGEKAFCAGGDVKAAIHKEEGPKFYNSQFTVNNMIGKYKIPYIALMNGYAMGGGLGVAVNGRYRVATEKTMVAMPETKIGLFPDVGATYFLPRLQDNLGIYLGLTGERLKGHDVVKAGLATHFVSSKKIAELEDRLTQCKNDSDVSSLLDKFHYHCEDFSLASNMKNIKHCFGASTVEEIIQRLEKMQNDWSDKTLKTLHQMCPGSLKISVRALLEGSRLDLSQCLKMEYRIVCRCIESHDFPEGVRALLIDKDNSPKWKPATLGDVTSNYVNNFFKELPQDKELKL